MPIALSTIGLGAASLHAAEFCREGSWPCRSGSRQLRQLQRKQDVYDCRTTPGSPGYDEYVRNGFAAGIEGLWLIGRITTETMVADFKALVQPGPCSKAGQVLRRLERSMQ